MHHYLGTAVVIAVGLMGVVSALGSTQPPAPAAEPLVLSDAVLDKNFYLYRVLESAPAWKILQNDPRLSELRSSYRSRLERAQSSCAFKAGCYVEAARLQERDIEGARDALLSLYATRGELRTAVAQLRSSGTMVLIQQDDRELLAATWRRYAQAINRILDVYGLGQPPEEGEIDAISFEPHSEKFVQLLRTALSVLLETNPKNRVFLSDPIQFAQLLLVINGRDEAGRLEPLDSGENRAALAALAHTDWAQFRYPLILVPGAGPEKPGVPLSGEGRLRLELAVTRYRQHLAPFILVSGGYVHPPQTPFCEAVEMKRALIEDYHIPPSAVLIDPHARHTTSNIRNAARLLYRYKMPFDRASLIVTDPYQINGIMDNSFDEDIVNESGSRPYIRKTKISPVEIEFLPSVDALQVNWRDPLDP